MVMDAFLESARNMREYGMQVFDDRVAIVWQDDKATATVSDVTLDAFANVTLSNPERFVSYFDATLEVTRRLRKDV